MSQSVQRDHREARATTHAGLMPMASSPVPTAISRASGESDSTTPRRRTHWLVLLSVLGPGIISAAAGNDAGGITTFSQVGAKYGLTLLWGLLLATIGL